MNDSIRAALVNVIKSNRQKMSRSQRLKGIKPQRWLYPLATEARYAATIRAWLRPMKDYVHTYLKENQAAILRGDSAEGVVFHLDSEEAGNLLVTRMDAVPGKSFKTMIDSLNGWLGQYVPSENESVSGSPIYMGLGKIADSVFDFNERQYEKGAKSVLGVEFPVGEDWWPDARELWAYNNYQTISGDMYKYVHDVNALVEKAVTSGLSVKELSKQIQALDDKLTKGRANFIARDQIGKLNGQISQMRMESVGLSMYVWETSGDERVRSTHRLMDGKLCRWDDATVYSDDGGKTWKDRGSGAVILHPGMDYQCRCTAIAYWQELVGEADDQIDLLSENEHNIPDTVFQGLSIMNPPSAQTNDEILRKKAEAKEARRRAENAKKARDLADQEFPGEQWISVEDGIYLSPHRKIGKDSQFENELYVARVFRDLGSTVYLTPESSRLPGKKYDAIVNELKFEIKTVGGNTNTLEHQFLRSRSQAPNVFINLENSKLTRREIMSTLFNARNKPETDNVHGYNHYNKFKGGRIILKIRGYKNLIYLNVDDLKVR